MSGWVYASACVSIFFVNTVFQYRNEDVCGLETESTKTQVVVVGWCLYQYLRWDQYQRLLLLLRKEKELVQALKQKKKKED